MRLYMGVSADASGSPDIETLKRLESSVCGFDCGKGNMVPRVLIISQAARALGMCNNRSVRFLKKLVNFIVNG